MLWYATKWRSERKHRLNGRPAALSEAAFRRYRPFGWSWQAHGPSRLRFGLCGISGIISGDGRLLASRRSGWSPRSGTQSGTLTAFSPVKLCSALGPASGAESAVLRGKAKLRGDCGRANSRGRPVDCCRSAGCWLAPWNDSGPARDGPRSSTRRIRRAPTHRPKHRI